MDSKIFDDASIGFLQNYNTIQEIEDIVDNVIANILRKEVDIKAKEYLKTIKKRLPSNHSIKFEESDPWTTRVYLKNSKGTILELYYGFEHSLELIHDNISPQSVYFVIYLILDIKGNGFKDKKELITFWREIFRSKLIEEGYILPNLSKPKEHPYAYYNIYSLLMDKILPFDKKIGKTTFTEQVLEAMECEYKDNLKYYIKLNEVIKAWRKKKRDNSNVN